MGWVTSGTTSEQVVGTIGAGDCLLSLTDSNSSIFIKKGLPLPVK
jgi:hypothetical protein